jgi:shikimate kinase
MKLTKVRKKMNIVLIGMSGAGKSTLGVLLAKALGMDFVDTDIIIRRHEGKLLQDIIDNDGIEKFMEVEEKIVSELQLKNCIISTGGSVIYSEIAMSALKQGGQVIYLHVPYEEIRRRLINITTRGIVIKKGNSLKDVYEERVPLYIKYSDKTVDCSDKVIEDCVSEIIEKIQESRCDNISQP